MNRTEATANIERVMPLLAALLVIAVTVATGIYVGNWVGSPDWQAAVRLAVMGGLVFAILVSPIDGLMLWIMIAPFGEASWTEIWRILNFRMPTGIPDLTPDRLAVAVLSIVFVAQLGIGKRKLQRLGAELFMAAFCIMVLPAAVAGFSGLNQSGQLLLDKFITPFLAFVLAKNLYQERDGLDKLDTALAVIGLYLALMVFYEHLTGQPLFVRVGGGTAYSKSLRKIISLLGNPAFLGTVLGMIVPIALHQAVRGRSPYRRAFYGGLFVLTLLGNFFVYNRGAWLALAAALLVMLLERRYRRILLPIILIGAMLALVYWQVISTSAVVTERLSNVSSIEFRLTMLEVSSKIVRDNLLFGVGLDNFAYYFLEYGGHWETLAYDLPSPHNTFVLVLSTMGLVSFVPYFLIFLSMFLKMARALRRSRWDEQVDSALLVSGLAVIAVYMVSAAAVDLYVNVFTSLVFFLITGTIVGYTSRLPPSKPRAQAAASEDGSIAGIDKATVRSVLGWQ
jgi:O-antigen ligase